MKNKATGFLKRIMSMLTSVAKAKTLALKSKTNALRARIIIFSLLRNKKILMSSISQKLHALVGQQQEDKDREEDIQMLEDQNRALVLYHHNSAMSLPNSIIEDNNIIGYGYEDGDDEKYPDLTHSLFESDDQEFEDPGGSVIDLVKNSKEDQGEEFRLEDEIDHVADLFIRRFHRQMRLQKQQSMKRHQEMMLQRSV